MYQFLLRFTATGLLALCFGLMTASEGGADMGHGTHDSQPSSPAAAPHGHDHGEPAHGASSSDSKAPHADHGHHGTLDVSSTQAPPAVALAVTPDPVGGWNLEIQTENWAFAPERVNQSSVITEGHAHLYVNGEKLTRIYSQWFYLPSLPPGEHVLRVELNANGHEALIQNGELIDATVTLVVPEA